MAVCEGLALVNFARNEKWQDCQGGLARVATLTMAKFKNLTILRHCQPQPMQKHYQRPPHTTRMQCGHHMVTFPFSLPPHHSFGYHL